MKNRLPSPLETIGTHCAANSVEHYSPRVFQVGEIVWVNYSKKRRLGTYVNVSKTYQDGGRIFKSDSDGETWTLPKSVLQF